MDESPETLPETAQERTKFGWLAFYILLLAPAVLMLIMLSSTSNSEIVGTALFSVGVIMNLYCGFWSAFRWVRRSPVWASVLAIVMAVVYFCLNVVVFFFGCLAIGPKLY